MLNILPKVRSLPSLLAINLIKLEIQIFQTVTWPDVNHSIKGSCLGATNKKSVPCLLLCQYGWRCVFYLSPSPTRPLRWDVMRIHGWELVAAYHHPANFGDHRHCNSKRKNASSKTWILQIRSATEKFSWLDNH